MTVTRNGEEMELDTAEKVLAFAFADLLASKRLETRKDTATDNRRINTLSKLRAADLEAIE